MFQVLGIKEDALLWGTLSQIKPHPFTVKISPWGRLSNPYFPGLVPLSRIRANSNKEHREAKSLECISLSWEFIIPLAELQRDFSQGLEFLKLVRGGSRGNRKKGPGTCFCFLDGPISLPRIKKINPKDKIRIIESMLETWPKPGKINVLPSIPLLEDLVLALFDTS